MRLIVIMLLVLSLGMASVMAAPLGQTPPRPINFGQTAEGEINDVQQAVQYIFDAQAGDTISLLMQTTSGDLNAYLSLATFDGAPIAEDDDSGGGTDALIQVTIEAAGSYVVTATRARNAPNGGGAGAFTVRLSTEVVPLSTEGEVLVGDRLQPIQRGTPLQAALTPEQAFSLFWFEGRSAETITLTPDPGTRFKPLLVLYDSSFTELLRSSPGVPLTVTLPEDDLYFVAASLPDALSTGGAYTLTLSGGSSAVVSSPPREVQAGQNAIAYGESVRGTISNTAAAFTFQFRGSVGDVVTIDMARAGGDLDSYLYLLDSGGVTIAEDDNSGGSNGDARISISLPEAGDYLVLATRRGRDAGTTSGNFLLSLQSDAAPIVIPTAVSGRPPNLANFPEIRFGETVSGTISNDVFLSVYVFQANQDDEIIASMESTSNLDPLLILLDANQEPLAENDDISQQTKDSEITFTIPQTGYYVLVASRFEQDLGNTEGSYDLSLRLAGEVIVESDPAVANSLVRRLDARPIVPGSTPAGSFSPPRFANVYTFGITDPASLIDFSVSTDNNIATTVIMADDNLRPVATTDGGTLLGVPVPNSGTFVFIVAPASGPVQAVNENYFLAFNATGDNPVTVIETPEGEDDGVAEEETPIPEAEVISITYGESVSGTLSEDVTSQSYVFSGLEGDIVRINMSAAAGSSVDTLLRLLDDNGEVLEENDDIVNGQNRNSLLQTELPADGEYTIQATRFSPTDGTPATEGDYNLALEIVDPAAAGISPTVLPISSGETVTNTVNDEQYLMFYSFEGSSGEVVTIEVNAISGDLDAVLYLLTYTSAGQSVELTSNDDSLRGGTFNPLIEDYSLPISGTYLIGVGRFPDSPSSGDFTMTLTINPAGSIVPDSEESTTDG
jgi:Bacterial pre-peptidase C-terminal domain